ncbi:MAG TPA: hypothetical protein VGM44_14435, partial [Polyangiaceae bacterium]
MNQWRPAKGFDLPRVSFSAARVTALGRPRVERRAWSVSSNVAAPLSKTVISHANLLLCFISGQAGPSLVERITVLAAGA